MITIPLAPRTIRAIDLPTGEWAEGPIVLTVDGRRLYRCSAGRIVRRAWIAKRVGPHTLRHEGVPLRDVQEAASHADPHTTMRYGGPAAR